ncbi:hypothetical protein K7432_011589 [Basidiobolus ranarum]|uniref:Uncharacterized protein n=1 Tax=Basidiobolus ranarum TaxID=34480 RepID=A0ABR2VUC8_9FUNG
MGVKEKCGRFTQNFNRERKKEKQRRHRDDSSTKGSSRHLHRNRESCGSASDRYRQDDATQRRDSQSSDS